MYIKYDLRLKQISKDLRKKPTQAEKYMWNFLRVHYPKVNFFRQKPLDNFIVDFYCPERNLIIEIDGSIHDLQKERDQERDNLFLHKYELNTIRFSNDEVFTKSDYLKKRLDEVLC